ncbi:hypothetical protein P5V15_005611 [Pogonomyrmex californicus]
MITCAVNNCPSTQNTEVDGNPIAFFPFPEDNVKKNQWLRNCDLLTSDKVPLHICELHFEKIYFTSSKDLKSTAVPTIFESLKESKVRNIQTTPLKILSKQKKLDEHSHTLVTPPQSPSIQDNPENLFSGNKAEASTGRVIALNGSTISTSTHDNLQGTKTYRLIIQIDKIRGKPGPKCKKVPLVMLHDMKDTEINKSETERKLRTLRIKKPCIKGNCKLKKCIYNSKLAFQCEMCDKYYFAKKAETNNFSCTKCYKTFPNPQSLYVHIRKHFICDICQTECNSQSTYDKHIRLHVSTDPSFPYKCHQCRKVFDVKDSVKQHCLLEHSKINVQNTILQVTSPSLPSLLPQQNDFFCANCNISFKNDQAYRNHISTHGKKESFTCNIKSETNNIIPVPNPLTGSQIGILQAVKFSCRLCSKEFDNVAEVDLHTRTHLEVSEGDLKCNICYKSFNNNEEFTKHLKHHLSRAYPCPICSKAFINRTTLNIHLKTHSTL